MKVLLVACAAVLLAPAATALFFFLSAYLYSLQGQ
jgi:hypothetical protein